MIVDINTPDGTKSLLLGYETLKLIAALQKQGDKTEFELIELITVSGINVFAKRKGLPAVTLDQVIEWFDDLSIFQTVQEAITEFSENFTQKGSLKPETPKAAKAAKK
jgi:hypothetical protein